MRVDADEVERNRRLERVGRGIDDSAVQKTPDCVDFDVDHALPTTGRQVARSSLEKEWPCYGWQRVNVAPCGKAGESSLASTMPPVPRMRTRTLAVTPLTLAQ